MTGLRKRDPHAKDAQRSGTKKGSPSQGQRNVLLWLIKLHEITAEAAAAAATYNKFDSSQQ